ncbi:MAG TPA: trehalase family glycosidase [Chitinophagaceae bacterium]|nr:trehalase family glycosidase [Chitinophagaceae bacterium]
MHEFINDVYVGFACKRLHYSNSTTLTSHRTDVNKVLVKVAPGITSRFSFGDATQKDIEMKCCLLIGILFVFAGVCDAQRPAGELPLAKTEIRSAALSEDRYKKMQRGMASGWNTFNTQSVISHVKLPEGLAINLRFKNNNLSDNRFLHESYFSEKQPRPEHVVPGYHAWDGSYTELTINWEGAQYKVETASEGRDFVALVTPLKLSTINQHLVIEAAMLWNRSGSIQKLGNGLSAKAGNNTWLVSTTAALIDDPLPLSGPYLATVCSEVIGVSAGRQRSLAAIKALVQQKRTAFETELNKYGPHKETYLAQQSVLAWNTIYDPQRAAVIAPVSRVWNSFFGGHFVLFDWDTYLSGLMASWDNKALAYANVVEVTKTVDLWGMVPNYVAAHGLGSPDRSQPPVGSMAVYELYKKFGDRWLLDATYNRLLTWNRWWPKHRDTDGFLCWGTNPVPPDGAANTWQGAGYETGLDNSPMYEGVPFDTVRHQMPLADVGLMGLYIADCNYLALLADVMHRSADAKELRERAAKYSASLQKLWHEEKGMFLNRRTDNGEWSFRLSPTLFYPLIAKAATPQQAERMVKEHLLNEKEFWGEWVLPSIARNDSSFTKQDYWKGRIWAPLNFLVYQGLKQYNFPEVVKALVEKSNALLMKNWRETRGVYENYHASGVGRLPGEEPGRSDNFYHWGALLGYMYLVENTSPQLKKQHP